MVTPGVLGGGTIAFCFQAKKKEKDTVVLVIDGEEYTYHFNVLK